MATAEQVKTYWDTVAGLEVYKQIGPASDGGREILIVDWSSKFSGTTRESASWVLGFDPVTQEWIEEQARFTSFTDYHLRRTLEQLHNHEVRISTLEKK